MYSEPSFPLSLYLPASPPIYYAYYLMIIFPSEHHVVGDFGTVLEFAALKPNASILLCEQIECLTGLGI